MVDLGDPGRCPECGKSWKWVRFGKSQPTCRCDDKCPSFAVGEIAKNLGDADKK